MSKKAVATLKRYKYLILAVIVAAGLLVGMMVWLHLREDTSYEACVRDGNTVLGSYPSICITKDGRHYADPHEFVKDAPL